MTFERRVSKLEEKIKVVGWDPETDAELTAWFKENPDSFTQQPEGQEIRMPDHLREAWLVRLDRVFKKHDLKKNLSSLASVWGEVYPTFFLVG